MEYHSALKRNKLSSHENTWRNLKCIIISKRSYSEKATYCMIPTLWHSGKGKTMETVKSSVVARSSRERGMNMWSIEVFRAMKLFCMILHWWTHPITHVSKSVECTWPMTMNLNINCGFCMIIICQCRFINCKKKKKRITVVWDTDSGESYACVGKRINRNSLCSLLNFVVNLKLL